MNLLRLQRFLFIISLFFNTVFTLYFLLRPTNPENTVETVSLGQENNIKESDDQMSDWNMFTMALMKVESEYDSTQVSSKGAKGYFQITPVYVNEVNRVHNTNYSMNDVLSFDSAYEIFDLMQKAHNPDYSMKTAIQLHNGKSYWYRKRVMNAYEDIKKYEKLRRKVVRT